MAVRTQTLALVGPVAATGDNVVYTCPAGRTAICKDWVVMNRGGGSRTMNIHVRRGATVARLQANAALAHLGTLEARERYVVLEPGDQLVVFVGGEVASLNVDIYVGGVELEGVAPA